jgi:hypothetical protein
MKRIELQDTELQTANNIVQKYRDAETELDVIQQKLLELDEQKKDLLSRVEIAHGEEINFFQQLESKYGIGKLDLLTFEYIKINK